MNSESPLENGNSSTPSRGSFIQRLKSIQTSESESIDGDDSPFYTPTKSLSKGKVVYNKNEPIKSPFSSSITKIKSPNRTFFNDKMIGNGLCTPSTSKVRKRLFAIPDSKGETALDFEEESAEASITSKKRAGESVSGQSKNAEGTKKRMVVSNEISVDDSSPNKSEAVVPDVSKKVRVSFIN